MNRRTFIIFTLLIIQIILQITSKVYLDTDMSIIVNSYIGNIVLIIMLICLYFDVFSEKFSNWMDKKLNF